MPAPTPIVTPIPTFADLPAGGNVPLSGADSIVSLGATYTWQLVETPDGSNAQLQNSTTATPTLTNVDVRGTYIVFLKITDSGGSSHPAPYPIQATTAPYGFNVPLATAFGVVRVAESPSGLVKPGRGEYGWFEQGLWPLVDKVNNGLDFPYYDIPTHTLTANAVQPSSGTSSVEINGLHIADAPSAVVISPPDGSAITLAALTNAANGLTVTDGFLRADEIRDASGGSMTIAPNDGLMVSTTKTEIATPGATLKLQSGDLTATTIAGDIFIDSGNDIVLTTVATDGELRLASAGANGDIKLETIGTDADILLSTVGPTANITLATSGSNGDIILATTGSDGDISLLAQDDILLTTTGADSDISLTAPGASSSISLTAGQNVAITAPAGQLYVEGSTAIIGGLSACTVGTSDGDLTLSIGGYDPDGIPPDRKAAVIFHPNNRRRIIDLDGFVAQRNHIATKGGALYPITVLPGNAPALVPLRANVTMSYHNEALEGFSSTADFTLSFHASFNVTGFTTIGSNNLTFSFVAYDSSDPSTRVTLATFNFTPGGSLEVTDRPCIIQGMVHSVGGKNVHCSGMASLQVSDTTNVTLLSAAEVAVSGVFLTGGTVVFAFLVNSVDTNVTVTNRTGVCSLIRGS